MADSEVATKAPESDAIEETTASFISGDTPAQSGGSLGVSCMLNILVCFTDLLKEQLPKPRATRQYFQRLLTGNEPFKTACADLFKHSDEDQVVK